MVMFYNVRSSNWTKKKKKPALSFHENISTELPVIYLTVLLQNIFLTQTSLTGTHTSENYGFCLYNNP